MQGLHFIISLYYGLCLVLCANFERNRTLVLFCFLFFFDCVFYMMAIFLFVNGLICQNIKSILLKCDHYFLLISFLLRE